MILQRYTFGSKSQLDGSRFTAVHRCLWYCKDIHLEANHNLFPLEMFLGEAAYDIAKIYIWKQITTRVNMSLKSTLLLMILQRYTFGSKSQRKVLSFAIFISCLWYCKDIHLEANHNQRTFERIEKEAAYDIAKIYIWKQITTICLCCV